MNRLTALLAAALLCVNQVFAALSTVAPVSVEAFADSDTVALRFDHPAPSALATQPAIAVTSRQAPSVRATVTAQRFGDDGFAASSAPAASIEHRGAASSPAGVDRRPAVVADTGASQTFVFEGDSLSVDTDGRHYPSLVMAGRYASGQGAAHKLAVSGSRLADVIARYDTGARTFRPAAVHATQGWLFLWIGANDWATANPTDWLTRWKAYLAQARADGFQLCAFTVMRRADVSEPINRVRDAINDGIRAARGSYEILIDVETMFDPSNRRGTGYHDGVHLPAAAQSALGRAVADALFAGFANRAATVALGAAATKSKVIVTGGTFNSGIMVFDTAPAAGANPGPRPRLSIYRPRGTAGQYLATRLGLNEAATFEVQYAGPAALGAHIFTNRRSPGDEGLIFCDDPGSPPHTLATASGPVTLGTPDPAGTGHGQLKTKK